MRFVEMFWSDNLDIEDQINERADRDNLRIISTSICVDNKGNFFVMVVFEKWR
jgi:hypothetical protein